MSRFPLPGPSRRDVIAGTLAASANILFCSSARATQPPGFAKWVGEFRSRALGRGISTQTYARVMDALEPDVSALEQVRSQPELIEPMWQYINRRCSDWRVVTGKERAREQADLLARIEKEYGVDRYI